MSKDDETVSLFKDRLLEANEATKSLLCVGLDPDPLLMPIPDVLAFNRAIVDATKDLVCVYKPNLAFYEALGIDGLDVLKKTVEYIHDQAPKVIVLGDAKRGDVDNTNVHYARALFEYWGFDAVTVSPYLGGEALGPFIRREDKGIFVLCRTSNPGARELQDMVTMSGGGDDRPLYEQVALHASQWSTGGNVGLVVGATYIEELKTIRSLCPDMPILVPGVGSQGGDLERAVRFGADSSGRSVIISSSRGIIYASKDVASFPEAARKVAMQLREAINRALKEDGRGW